MRRLTLIRHARSSRDYPLLDDIDRPLDARGRSEAPEMAQRLKAALTPPLRLVSSPAMRALTTAQAFAEVLEIPDAGIQVLPEIYEATPGTLLHLVNRFDDADPQVLMFGHNPGLSELAQLLADMPFAELPTCAAATLAFEVASWRDVAPQGGKLLSYRFPKE